MILDYRKRPFGDIERRYFGGKIFLDGEEVHSVVHAKILAPIISNKTIRSESGLQIEWRSDEAYVNAKSSGDGEVHTFDLMGHPALVGVTQGAYASISLKDLVPSGLIKDIPMDIGIDSCGGPIWWERKGYLEIFTAAEFEELCRSGTRKITVDLIAITTIGDEWRQLRPGKLRLEPAITLGIPSAQD